MRITSGSKRSSARKPEEGGGLFGGAEEVKGRQVYSVSQLTQDIKIILENTFSEIWVEGEVSGIHRIPTGTTFFSLKDDASLLKCVIFASSLQEVKFELKDGIKVVCRGRVSLYDKRGEYQLYVQGLEPKGLGSLQLALEQLKARLEKEGLFAEAHKRPIPYLPKRLGLVTSLQGAAIKDILKVLDRRFRDVQVIISPARVQGEGAGAEVARAIAELNKFNAGLSPGERIEVMIVGRGGGSIEDLWAFNEEIVARAIYASEIPVVSAVGHERDWTIADLVADLRAATPSVAAELVLPQKEELKDRLGVSLRRMKDVFSGQLIESRQAVDDYAGRLLLASRHILELSGSYHNVLYKKLLLLNPEAIISRHKEKMLELARQVTTGTQHLLQLSQARLNKAAERLSGLSPLNILARGYSISFRIDDGAVIKEIKYLKPGDLVRTKLRDGDFISQVKEVI